VKFLISVRFRFLVHGYRINSSSRMAGIGRSIGRLLANTGNTLSGNALPVCGHSQFELSMPFCLAFIGIVVSLAPMPDDPTGERVLLSAIDRVAHGVGGSLESALTIGSTVSGIPITPSAFWFPRPHTPMLGKCRSCEWRPERRATRAGNRGERTVAAARPAGSRGHRRIRAGFH
jgi:hypothetical protein